MNYSRDTPHGATSGHRTGREVTQAMVAARSTVTGEHLAAYVGSRRRQPDGTPQLTVKKRA